MNIQLTDCLSTLFKLSVQEYCKVTRKFKCHLPLICNKSLIMTSIFLYLGCATKAGEKCAFPFIYNNKEYFKCTGDGGSGPWCATSVNNEGGYSSWEYCNMETCKTGKLMSSCFTTTIPFLNRNIYLVKFQSNLHFVD